MLTLHSLSTLMRGEERVRVVDGMSVTDVRVRFPEQAEKRENGITESSEGVKVMKESVKSQCLEWKRESVISLEDINSFITELSDVGATITVPSVKEEEKDSGVSGDE